MFLILFAFQLMLLFLLSKKVNKGIFRLLYKAFKDEKKAVYVYSLLFLPGTFIHELSHFLSAILLFVPVSEMVLIPKTGEKTIQMGEVKIAKTDLVRGTLVGLAPFIFGMVIISALVYFGAVKSNPPWYAILVGTLLIFEVANTMFVSSNDIRSALKLTLVIGIIVLILYFLGVRYSIDISRLSSQSVENILKKLMIFFSVPIILDIVIVVLTSLVGIGKRGVYED